MKMNVAATFGQKMSPIWAYFTKSYLGLGLVRARVQTQQRRKKNKKTKKLTIKDGLDASPGAGDRERPNVEGVTV